MSVSFFLLGPFHLPEITPVVSIAYKVLEVFPKGRWVLITCCAPQPPPPITYSLCGTKNIKVAKKVVKTHEPASFNLNVTLKSSPDLLTYFCRASSTSGAHVDSARLQMHWELWSRQRGRPQGGDDLPGVLGQPTYHQQPDREGWAGPPAAETMPQAACQLLLPAEPDIGLVLVPGCKQRQCPAQRPHSGAPRRVAQGTHHRAGWQPCLHCGHHLQDAGLDHVGQVVTRRWRTGRVPWRAPSLPCRSTGAPAV
ncbi:protein IL-40 isoform X5 [Homo sapiens]|uniref:protein IL-40 isoform X5 n=1 Tax=Homo sapiens TaxID=9606 RepID=UPI0023E03C86|nr:protein IL-40 isoform X5 [Homo sapiens]